MGRYDGGVPAEAIAYPLGQMCIPAAARARIEAHMYPAGHMMYVHEESRVALSGDIAAFIQHAAGRAN